MLDVYLEKFRWYIVAALVLIICGSSGYIFLNRYQSESKNEQNALLDQLTEQNNQLRAELSNKAAAEVAGVSTESQSGKININVADAAELDKLPGIGPARAADIIAYRESHGGFKSAEEIKNIKGIGDKSYESLKDLITIGRD